MAVVSPTLDSEPASHSGPFAALRIPDYRRYYIGQGVSLIGSWVQAAAVSWLVYEMTGSTRMLGLIEAANLMPGLLVGLLAGVVADRSNPRSLVLLMQMGQMALATVLAISVAVGAVRIWQMAAILALARVCVTFEMPSRLVFLYGIIGREALPNAIALNSGLFNASRVIGPMIAGVVLSTFGGTACFAANAASFLVSIGAVLSIRDRHRSADESSSRDAGRTGGIWGGFVHLARDRKLATLFILMTFFGMVGMGYAALVPAYADRVVGTDAIGYSVLLACTGVGATLGALGLAWLGGRVRRESLVTAGMLVFGVSLALAAWLPKVLGSLPLLAGSVCLVAVGVGAILFYASTQTLVQTTVPDHLRGRIMGVWMIAYSASVPFGALWAGELAGHIGVGRVMLVSALACIVTALVTAATRALVMPGSPPSDT